MSKSAKLTVYWTIAHWRLTNRTTSEKQVVLKFYYKTTLAFVYVFISEEASGKAVEYALKLKPRFLRIFMNSNW